MQIRKKHLKTKRSLWSIVIKIFLLLVGVWLSCLFFFQSSFETKSSGEDDGNQNEQEQQVKLTEENPHYGWQPASHSEEASSCKVRDCFKEKGTAADHPGCKICLDDPLDLQPVPEAPQDWVPDATLLHNMMLDGKDKEGQPWPPPISTDYCGAIGEFGGPNDPSKLLFDEVPIRGMPPSPEEEGPTIFCGVYTMEVNHAGNVRAMRETWAPHCDGFVAFSTASDPRIPAMAIEHEGPEEYDNMWQKSRAIWRYIGEHYLDQFDYFILGGEDLLVIPDNLRAYLKSLELDPAVDDLFAGRRFKGYGENNYFNSGGAGYVLSRATARKYYETGYDHPQCNPHRHTAMEDVMIAECLRNVWGIGLTDTRDDQQRERFHPFGPGGHYNFRPAPPGEKKNWYEDYNAEWGLKLGAECCAPDSVSFHYIKKPAHVRHIWNLLYNCDGQR